jgi:acyl carrier protein
MNSVITADISLHSTEVEIYATIIDCCGLKPEDCRPDSTIYELGIDSLGMASLVAFCESRLAMCFDDIVIQSMMSAQTLGQIVELLKSQHREYGCGSWGRQGKATTDDSNSTQ